jgi:hypothetical protein
MLTREDGGGGGGGIMLTREDGGGRGGGGATVNEGGSDDEFGSIMSTSEDRGGGGATKNIGGTGSFTDCGEDQSLHLEIHPVDADGNGVRMGDCSDGENVVLPNWIEEDED